MSSFLLQSGTGSYFFPIWTLVVLINYREAGTTSIYIEKSREFSLAGGAGSPPFPTYCIFDFVKKLEK